MTIRIATCQVDTTVGAIEQNVATILGAAREAAERGASLAVFPELCITGYPPRDLLNVDGFVRKADAALESIVELCPEGLVLVLGTVRLIEPRPAGRHLANAAVVLERGRILLEVPKTLLPTYDVFDERRYFEPAAKGVRRCFKLGDLRIGVTLCEDIWNDRELWGEKRLYDRDPVAETIEEGVDLIVNLSASPYSMGKPDLRARIISHAAKRWSRPIVFAASVGGNDGLIFDGGSAVVRADGEFVDISPLFEAAVHVVDLDSPPVARVAMHPMQELASALVLGLSDYAKKTGISGAMLGLSGGIDSALVAALASLAFGPQNVLGVAMPSRYSSDHSVNDAKYLAEHLGLQFEIVPIEGVHAAYESLLSPLIAPMGAAPAGDVTFENVQARVRGGILMALSNRTGRLLLTTGNKSECSVGYCTLYGDTCGGLAVIADLWKGQVGSLCRWLNEHKINGAIPESTLTKPPSAELRPGQRDDQSLPAYEVLDAILHELVECERGVEDTVRVTGFDIALVRDIAKKLYTAEYKRRQFAPSLRVSSRAWVGRDYPIAQRWVG